MQTVGANTLPALRDQPYYDQEVRIYDEDGVAVALIPNDKFVSKPVPQASFDDSSWYMTCEFLAEAAYNAEVLRYRKITVDHYVGTADVAGKMDRYDAFTGWITAATKKQAVDQGSIWRLECYGSLHRANWNGINRVRVVPANTSVAGIQLNGYVRKRTLSMIATGKSPATSQYIPATILTTATYGAFASFDGGAASVVIKNNAGTTLAVTTDYTVADGTSDQSGYGVITWVNSANAPAAGDRFTVEIYEVQGFLLSQTTITDWALLTGDQTLDSVTSPARYPNFLPHVSLNMGGATVEDVIDVSTNAAMTAVVEPGYFHILHDEGLILPWLPRKYLESEDFFLRAQRANITDAEADARALIETLLPAMTDLNLTDLDIATTNTYFATTTVAVQNEPVWEKVMEQIFQTLPPNYKLHDMEGGKVKAASYSQKARGSEDYLVQGFVSVEPQETPEVATQVVVHGRREKKNFARFWLERTTGSGDPPGTTNPGRITDGRYDVAATGSGSEPYKYAFKFPRNWSVTRYPFIEELRIYHKGRVKIGVSRTQATATNLDDALSDTHDGIDWLSGGPFYSGENPPSSPTVVITREQLLAATNAVQDGYMYLHIWGADWDDPGAANPTFALYEVEVMAWDMAVYRAQFTFATNAGGTDLTTISSRTDWNTYVLNASTDLMNGDDLIVADGGATEYLARISSISGGTTVNLRDYFQVSTIVSGDNVRHLAIRPAVATDFGAAWKDYSNQRVSYRHAPKKWLQRNMLSYSDGFHRRWIVDAPRANQADCATIAKAWADEFARTAGRTRVRCLYNPALQLGDTVRYTDDGGDVRTEFIWGIQKSYPLMELELVDYAL